MRISGKCGLQCKCLWPAVSPVDGGMNLRELLSNFCLSGSWRKNCLAWDLRDERGSIGNGHLEQGQLCLLCISMVQSCEMHTCFK